jgi:hypothetical protein
MHLRIEPATSITPADRIVDRCFIQIRIGVLRIQSADDRDALPLAIRERHSGSRIAVLKACGIRAMNSCLKGKRSLAVAAPI